MNKFDNKQLFLMRELNRKWKFEVHRISLIKCYYKECMSIRMKVCNFEEIDRLFEKHSNYKELRKTYDSFTIPTNHCIFSLYL